MKNKSTWWIIAGVAFTAIVGGITYVWYQSKKYRDAKKNRNIQIINTGS